jgi:hypothetical protein
VYETALLRGREERGREGRRDRGREGGREGGKGKSQFLRVKNNLLCLHALELVCVCVRMCIHVCMCEHVYI